jgi:hypothetical protein
VEDKDSFRMEYEKLKASFLEEVSLASKNTPQRLAAFRKFVTESATANPLGPAANMEGLWSKLTNEFSDYAETRENDLSQTPVEEFTRLVSIGLYPSPEVMLCITECFEEYLHEGGSISLDEAFYGTAHKKKSSAAFDYKNEKIFSKFDMFLHGAKLNKMGIKIGNYPTGAQSEIAEKFLAIIGGRESHIEPSSFLRKYQRWKQKQEGV